MSLTSGPHPPPAGSPGGPLRRARRDEGVAEVIGSVLMVALTVVVSLGVVALLVLSQPGPDDPLHVTLSLELAPGDGGWGTGDERVRLVHQGGEPIPASTTRVLVEIDGAGETFSHTASPVLDHGDETAFDDGEMRIGETWQTPDRLLPAGRMVHVNLVATQGDGAVAWSSSARIGTINCDTDVTAPRVQTWTQTPDDVSTSTTGDVTVRVKLIDACGNLDATVDPHLQYRLNDGTDPAFTDQGAMTPLPDDTWELAIPDQTWASHLGKDLEYKVTGMADTEGNTGESGVQSDPIQLAGTETYVTTPFIDQTEDASKVGQATDDDAARSADDQGAEARLEEAANGTTPAGTETRRYAATGTSSTGSFSPGTNAGASDDTYDTATDVQNPSPIRYTLADEPSAPGTIDTVLLKAEIRSAHLNDAWFFRACNSAGQCSAESGALATSTTDATRTYDITSLKPGGGSWSISDLNALEFQIRGQGQTGNADWYIDHAYVEVTYQTPSQTVYDMNIHATVDGLSGSTHILDLEHRASQDTFELHVWDGSQWNKRADLTATSSTRLTYPLDASEVAGGTVQLKFVDATTGPSQGSLFLDYVRVVSP